MSVKGVKLKSESYFLLSPGVLELWRKTLGGGGRIPPPGPDRVKVYSWKSAENWKLPRTEFWTRKVEKYSKRQKITILSENFAISSRFNEKPSKWTKSDLKLA